MTVSVVVCAYASERWDDLVSCLDSLAAQSRPPDEVIVVIDHHAELLERSRAAFATATVVPNAFEKGLSGARNTGVERSRGEVVAFLDDDATAEPTWLEELVAPFADERVAGVGGWIEPRYDAGPSRWLPESFLWVVGCSYRGLPGDGAAIRNPIGASMAFRREVFEVAGGFAHGIGRIGKTPLGGEETELSIRYSLARPEDRFVLATRSVVRHHVPAGRLRAGYFLRRCWAEGASKAIIARRHPTGPALGAESRHLLGVLPVELAGALAGAVRGRGGDVARALALVGGAAAAGAGFAVARLRPTSERAAPGAPPGLVTVLLDDDPPSTRPRLEPGRPVVAELWRDDMIVGVIETQLDANGEVPLATTSHTVEPGATPSVPDGDLPPISVVVCTLYERRDQLRGALEHLEALDYPDFEILVVDNRGQPDEPVDLGGTTRARVVPCPERGLSRARNTGVAAARHDIIAFTDDDAEAAPGWLRAIGTRFALDDQLDVVCGIVRPQPFESLAQSWFEEFFGGFTRHFVAQRWSTETPPDDPLFPFSPGEFGAGVNMATRRRAVERVGGFDLRLGPGTPTEGGEDLAFFVSVVLEGGVVGFEPRALVRHQHRSSPEAFLRQTWGYGVGLSSMMTAVALRHPRAAMRVLVHAPSALTRLVGRHHGRAPTWSRSYPRSARWRQLAGVLYGPVALWRASRRRGRASGAARALW